MNIPAAVQTFWSDFVATGAAKTEHFYESFAFGDGEALANNLAALVLSGVKRATTGALWCYEADGQRLPVPGDQSVVTNWDGDPLCVIETVQVDVVPFNQVSVEFAAVEGEGDGSLAYWTDAHRRYFKRECDQAGRAFSEDMSVVCERFKLVYQPKLSGEI